MSQPAADPEELTQILTAGSRQQYVGNYLQKYQNITTIRIFLTTTRILITIFIIVLFIFIIRVFFSSNSFLCWVKKDKPTQPVEVKICWTASMVSPGGSGDPVVFFAPHIPSVPEAWGKKLLFYTWADTNRMTWTYDTTQENWARIHKVLWCAHTADFKIKVSCVCLRWIPNIVQNRRPISK